MPILVGRDGGVQSLPELPAIQQTNSRTTPSLDDAVNAPVSYVPKHSGAFAWLGSLAESIRSGFRRTMLPAAACLVAGTLLLGGCASTGHHIRTVPVAPIGAQQHQKVDLDQVKRILEASDARELAVALQGVPNPRSVVG